MDYTDLINAARSVQEKSYSPYSRLKVGAALLTDKGTVYTGTNIENSSYSLTICAERVAIFNALSSGENEFATIVITSSGPDFIYPCGACLQVMAEFARDMQVVVVNKNNECREYKLSDLIPYAFVLDSQEG